MDLSQFYRFQRIWRIERGNGSDFSPPRNRCPSLASGRDGKLITLTITADQSSVVAALPHNKSSIANE